MANCHGGVAASAPRRQEQRQRFPYDVAAADDDGVLACRFDAGVDEHPLHPRCRAGHEPGAPLREEPGILRMESVDVAVGRHRIEHPLRVDMLRQG